MLQTSWLEVALGRLDSNLRLFRRLVGDNVKICGVIKSDAYSLGAVPLAIRLEAGGIDSLAVYSPAQAAEIYSAGLRTPLIILLPVRARVCGRALRMLKIFHSTDACWR